MVFQIQPATYSDLDAIADVLVKAHAIDRLFEQLMPRAPHDLRVKWYANAFRKTWEEKWMRFYKVVDSEIKLASFLHSSLFSYLIKILYEWLEGRNVRLPFLSSTFWDQYHSSIVLQETT